MTRFENLGAIENRLKIFVAFQRGIAGPGVGNGATPTGVDQADGNFQLVVQIAAVALKNAQLYNQAHQEITERVKALKKERNFAATVLDTAGALVMVLNPQGRILRFNILYFCQCFLL